MAAATSAHYIRTIHTSFTAAHPHSSSAWATHASASAVARAHAHSNILHNLTGAYNNAPPSAKYPPGLPTSSPTPTGRKRSASIRVAPPAYAQRLQPQRIKFDPFADEPEPSSPVASSVLYNTPHHHHHHHHLLPPSRSPSPRPASMPLTIQIPPAAPADIQKHHQQQQQYRQQLRAQQQQQQVQVPSSRPSVPVQQPRAPTPVSAATASVPATPVTTNATKEREARSKIVAGILLNRVHAVGKPMRRRATAQPRAYVPSGLSTCISIEA